jgi:integrase
VPRQRKQTNEHQRVRGEGTRWQVADGRWRGQLPRRRDPITGKVVRPSCEGRTEKEVIDELAKLRVRYGGRAISVTARSTLADYLESWLRDKLPSLRPRTGQRYGENLAPVIGVLGTVRLEDLTAQHVDRCLDELSHRRGADGEPIWVAATINRMREVLRNALNDAVRNRILLYNAAEYSNPRKTMTHVPVVIDTSDKLARFLTSAEGEDFRIASRPHIVALLTGLRIGEICGLRWEDINFDEGRMTVNREIQRIRLSIVETMPASYERWRGLVAMDPKTKKSKRNMAVPGKVMEILEAQRQTQELWREIYAKRWTDHRFVFTTRHGTPVDPGELLGQLKRILVKAGLPKMRFHDLRHSFVVLLTIQGVPPTVILQLTGWTSISQLQRYSHYTNAMEGIGVRAIDSVLAAAGA